MKITERINEREFVHEHGRAPKGQGGWLFQVEGVDEWVNVNGTYTEARREIVRRYPDAEITVLP